MKCWMCRSRSVKQISRCKTCREERCIERGHDLQVFVRTIRAVKFRKKQWEHILYEHKSIVKTRTFEKLCVNPYCPKHWDPAKLPPDWILVDKPKVQEKKTFDEVIKELEQSTT